MIPLCFPKISMNLWVPPAIFEKQIKIKLLHPASTLESRIQVYIIVAVSARTATLLPSGSK
ncbi:MAG: hypothetical protein P8X79_20340 [Reinekea sp.]